MHSPFYKLMFAHIGCVTFTRRACAGVEEPRHGLIASSVLDHPRRLTVVLMLSWVSASSCVGQEDPPQRPALPSEV